MADKRPVVFLSRGAPPDPLQALKEFCEVRQFDGQGFIPRDQFLQEVRGVHALFVHPPDRVDAELLDAAGEKIESCLKECEAETSGRVCPRRCRTND